MTRFKEIQIEFSIIQHIESLGYHCLYGPNFATDETNLERDNYQRLKHAVRRIIPDISVDSQNETIKEIQRIASPELIANSETFNRLLTEDILVTKIVDGDDRGDRVCLIDFKDPDPQFPLAYFIFKDIEWGGKVEIQN